jgi:hypothetical protein
VLAWAREALSGSAAVDALSAGPDGVLSAVANRQDKGVRDEGLAHEANHDDSAALLGRWQPAREERHVALTGLPTDGSPLSPEPSRTVFGDVPQQLGPFHVMPDLTQGIVRAVANARQRLGQTQPTWTRGRPSSQETAARRVARQRQNSPQ